MTPKEKADELVMKIYYSQDETLRWTTEAKKAALICVDEILEAIDWHVEVYPSKEAEYWTLVKSEIEKL